MHAGRRLPTFLVIGAMKAGTTSLYAYLREHPQIFLPEVKELDFFIAERNWPRGVDWYASNFAAASGAHAIGEVSPNYTKRHMFGGVPERIHELIPDVRLVYVVRDPVARMRSHYLHAVAESGLRMPIGEALLEHDHLALCSSYAHQLDPYLNHFPRERLLILTAEGLRDRRRAELERVFRFLGVDPDFEPPELERELHRTSEKRVPRAAARRWPEIATLAERAPGPAGGLARRAVSRELGPDEASVPPDVEAELRRRLAPDLERLRQIAGDDLAAWPPLSLEGAVGR